MRPYGDKRGGKIGDKSGKRRLCYCCCCRIAQFDWIQDRGRKKRARRQAKKEINQELP